MTTRPNRDPLWRDHRFATYWAAQAGSQFGDRISELAIPLIAVVALHASPTALGLLTAAVWAPNLLSLFVGSWVEQRPSKRRIMIAADLLRFAVLASLPVAHLLGAVTMTQLVLIALLTGAGQVLNQTAYQPFFVGLVRRDKFIEANSLLSGTRSISFIAGPAVGGVLIQLLTAPIAIAVDSLTFLWSALLLRRIRVDEAPVAPTDEPGIMARARYGMRFVTRHPYLRASLACSSTINLFTMIAGALLILFASRNLDLSAGVIGLALGIGATGALVGAVFAGRLSRLIGVGRAIALGGVVFAMSSAFVPLAGGSTLARAAVIGAVEFVAGFGVMCFDVNLNAVQTAVTPDAVRSRVSGAFATVNYGVRPVGAVLGGVLGTVIGVGPTMVIAGVGGTTGVLWLLWSPIYSTRRVEDLGPVDVPAARKAHAASGIGA